MEETASTASVMRVMNERAVFERIRLLGPVSRPQLAEATGLSKPTISLALVNLEGSGLVRHVGQSSGNSGRAALLYEMRPEAGWVVGVDVGRSWLRIALANLAGEVVLRRQERSLSRDAKKLVAQMGAWSPPSGRGRMIDQDVTYTVIGVRELWRRARRDAARRQPLRMERLQRSRCARRPIGSRLPWRTTSTSPRSANRPTGSERESPISSSSP